MINPIPAEEIPQRGHKTGETGDTLIGRPHPHAITVERPDEGDEAELVERLVAIVRGAVIDASALDCARARPA
jgi:hypothetical protein